LLKAIPGIKLYRACLVSMLWQSYNAFSPMYGGHVNA
jgi:hypothetical protein